MSFALGHTHGEAEQEGFGVCQEDYFFLMGLDEYLQMFSLGLRIEYPEMEGVYSASRRRKPHQMYMSAHVASHVLSCSMYVLLAPLKPSQTVIIKVKIWGQFFGKAACSRCMTA